MASTPGRKPFECPEDIARANKDLINIKQEGFYLLLFDVKNRKIARRKTVFKGTLHATICHPREIFKEAVLASAYSIVVLHNHPSGDPAPSDEDKEIANKLISSGEIIGIPILDFIIIGKEGYYSFGEEQNEENQKKNPGSADVLPCQAEPEEECQHLHPTQLAAEGESN